MNADVHPEAAPAKPGRVNVRRARDQADITAMIALGRLLHGESLYRTLPPVWPRSGVAACKAAIPAC